MEQPPAPVAIAPANPEPPTRTARKSVTIPDVVKSVGTVLAVFIVGPILANVGAAIIGLLMKWTTPDTPLGHYQETKAFAMLPHLGTWLVGLFAMIASWNANRGYSLFGRVIGGVLAGVLGIGLAAQENITDSMVIGGVVVGALAGAGMSKKS
jgi:hypothetical protein